MMNKIQIGLILALVLTACDKQIEEHEPKEVVKHEPPFPAFGVYEILALNKNERAELERRCLGVQHQTCTNFRSQEFIKMDNNKKGFCEALRESKRALKQYRQALDGSQPVLEAIKGCEAYF